MLDNKRILCHRCVQAYRDAGYKVKPLAYQAIKQSCDICTRMGYEYVIEDKEQQL